MSFPFLNCFTEQTIAQDTDGSRELCESCWTWGKNLNWRSDGKSRLIIIWIIYGFVAFYSLFILNLAHILNKLCQIFEDQGRSAHCTWGSMLCPYLCCNIWKCGSSTSFSKIHLHTGEISPPMWKLAVVLSHSFLKWGFKNSLITVDP